MKILITGSNGFISENIEKTTKFDLTFITRGKTENNKINWKDASDVDYCSYQYVFHLATNYGRDGKTVDHSNVELPMRIVQSMKPRSDTKFINFDSFFCKMKHRNCYMKNYVDSKIQFQTKMESELRKKNIEFTTLRLEHVFGIHDKPGKFIPWLVQKMDEESPIALTSGEVLRDFVAVDDLSRYLVAITNQPSLHKKWGSVLEFGTGKTTSVRDLILKIATVKKFPIELLDFGRLELNKNEIRASKAKHSSEIRNVIEMSNLEYMIEKYYG